MTQDEGDPLSLAEISDPVPAEEAFDGDHKVLHVRLEGLQQFLPVAVELPVDQFLAGLVEDAEVETPGVQVNSAVELVLPGVESHRGLLGERVFYSPHQPTAWVGSRGPQLVSRGLKRTDTALSRGPAA